MKAKKYPKKTKDNKKLKKAKETKKNNNTENNKSFNNTLENNTIDYVLSQIQLFYDISREDETVFIKAFQSYEYVEVDDKNNKIYDENNKSTII